MYYLLCSALPFDLAALSCKELKIRERTVIGLLQTLSQVDKANIGTALRYYPLKEIATMTRMSKLETLVLLDSGTDGVVSTPTCPNEPLSYVSVDLCPRSRLPEARPVTLDILDIAVKYFVHDKWWQL